MKESTLVKWVKDHLPSTLHSQSMTFGSLSMNGTPDRYFDGPKGDLWVEFKQLSAMPRDGLVGGVDDKKRGCYSSLQYRWMARRWSRGRNVLGVIGLPDKRVVIQGSPTQWSNKSPISNAVPRQALIETIIDFCGR